MNKNPSLGSAMEKTQQEPRKRKEPLYNAKSTPARWGKRGITYYVEPSTLQDLKDIAHDIAEEGEEPQLKVTIRAALNLILQKHGKKTTA